MGHSIQKYAYSKRFLDCTSLEFVNSTATHYESSHCCLTALRYHFSPVQLTCGLVPTIVNISPKLIGFARRGALRYGYTCKYTPITNVIRTKDRLLWDKIMIKLSRPHHEPPPPQRLRDLRNRDTLISSQN